MKKAIIICWIVFAAAIILFGVIVFNSSTQNTWQAFSVLMPLAGLAFWGAVILTIVYSFRSKKK